MSVPLPTIPGETAKAYKARLALSSHNPLTDACPFGLIIAERIIPCESLMAAQAMYLALGMLYRRDYGKNLGEAHISGPKRGYRIDVAGRVWAGKRKVLA